MAYKYDSQSLEEQFTSYLTDVLKKVETEADPDELAKLKKVFKKTVPLGRRSYVAAYLTKTLLTSGYRSRFGKKNERPFSKDFNKDFNKENTESVRFEKSGRFNSEKPAAPKGEKRPERAPRVQIDESLSTTIFVGIGRNRRVYPRDLVGLLVSVANISRDRIGDIRVLGNYSFIQLFTEDCEKAISSLNGYDYRGRKLSVSYSSNNTEDMKSENTAVNANTESTSSVDAESAGSVNTAGATENSVNANNTESSVSDNASGSYLV